MEHPGARTYGRRPRRALPRAFASPSRRHPSQDPFEASWDQIQPQTHPTRPATFFVPGRRTPVLGPNPASDHSPASEDASRHPSQDGSDTSQDQTQPRTPPLRPRTRRVTGRKDEGLGRYGSQEPHLWSRDVARPRTRRARRGTAAVAGRRTPVRRWGGEF